MSGSVTRWTAIVPMKQGATPKSRLSALLSLEQRNQLTDILASRVLQCLSAAPEIARTIIVSPQRRPGFSDWIEDKGRGLNAELEAARALLDEGRILIIHADLPLLETQDMRELLRAAERSGAAIAPDRHGEGTNALALSHGAPFSFAFGEASCAKHLAIRPDAALVRRLGLSHDIDTPDDLAVIVRAGWKSPF